MVGYSEPRLLAMGDAAWTVELGPDIDIDVNARCMGLAASIADAVASGELGGVVDIVPTFRSVTVHFDPRHSSAPTIPSHLQALARAATPPIAAKRTWRLPACFDSRYAPDLQAVADRHHLSQEAVVAQFLSTPLRVYAMDQADCYWLAQLYGLHLVSVSFHDTPFTVMKINRVGEGAKITIEDGNGGVLEWQGLHYAEFPFDDYSLFACWAGEYWVGMLPSEY